MNADKLFETFEYEMTILFNKNSSEMIKFPLFNGKCMMTLGPVLERCGRNAPDCQWMDRVSAVHWKAPEIKSREEWKKEF